MTCIVRSRSRATQADRGPRATGAGSYEIAARGRRLRFAAADTKYDNVGEVVLPSRLSTLSALRGAMPDRPSRLGLYAPVFEYTRDIAGTSALERWVSDVGVGSASPGARPPATSTDGAP